jgi:hypothetical protein
MTFAKAGQSGRRAKRKQSLTFFNLQPVILFDSL